VQRHDLCRILVGLVRVTVRVRVRVRVRVS